MVLRLDSVVIEMLIVVTLTSSREGSPRKIYSA